MTRHTDALTVLEARLRELVEQAPGAISVAVHGPGEPLAPAWIDLDAHRPVPAASTIKVAILLAALAEVEAGRAGLDETVPIGAERVGGAGALPLLPSVDALPLREALALMIALSDNDATNAVLDRVGMDTVNAYCRRLGCQVSTVRRAMMDTAARAAGRDNTTTAGELAYLLAELASGRALREPLATVGWDLLREQQDRVGLAGYLDDSVEFAGKSGELPGLRHDCGLLSRDGRWLAVAVTATDLSDEGIDVGTSVLPVFATIGAMVATLL